MRKRRPYLPSTLWLAGRLTPGRPYHHLYRPWLAEYQRTQGHEPADPPGSFRAAVRSARRYTRSA